MPEWDVRVGHFDRYAHGNPIRDTKRYPDLDWDAEPHPKPVSDIDQFADTQRYPDHRADAGIEQNLALFYPVWRRRLLLLLGES